MGNVDFLISLVFTTATLQYHTAWQTRSAYDSASCMLTAFFAAGLEFIPSFISFWWQPRIMSSYFVSLYHGVRERKDQHRKNYGFHIPVDSWMERRPGFLYCWRTHRELSEQSELAMNRGKKWLGSNFVILNFNFLTTIAKLFVSR